MTLYKGRHIQGMNPPPRGSDGAPAPADAPWTAAAHNSELSLEYEIVDMGSTVEYRGGPEGGQDEIVWAKLRKVH